MARPDWPNLRVAITGASSGIGAAAAELLAAKGASVSLMARRKDRLEEVAERCRKLGAKNVFLHVGDVGSLDDVRRFASETSKKIGDVDAVVANAGFGSFGHTLDLPPEGLEHLMRTNVMGVIWTVQAFGNQLSVRKGHVVVIGSVVSRIAVPYSSAYSATKWALRGWTRGVRPELEERGITITLLNPGYVKTEFFKHRLTRDGEQPWHPARGMTAHQVGERVLRAIHRKPAEMQMTMLARLGVPVYRLMPIQWPRILAKSLRKRLVKR